MTPSISLVVPFLNEEKFLGRCLEAILKQTMKPDEVILVDNGSTDRSIKVAKVYEKKFERERVSYRIFSVEERSQVYARELGFEKVKSELVATLDADSEIVPNWIKVAKAAFAQQEVVAVGGPFYYYNGSWWFNLFLWTFFRFWYLALRKRYSFWGCNGVFRRDAYKKVGGLDGYWEMDRTLRLNYVFDDNFLSCKLEKVGSTLIDLNLIAMGDLRTDFKRFLSQSWIYYKIREYVNKRLEVGQKIDKAFARPR